MISADRSRNDTHLATDGGGWVAQERLEVPRLLASGVPETSDFGATEAIVEYQEGVLVETLHVSRGSKKLGCVPEGLARRPKPDQSRP